MLRGKELATRLACIGCVVGNQEFVGIAKQIDMGTVKIPEIQAGYTFEHSRQAVVLFLNGVAESVAGGVEIGKQALYVALRWVAVSGGFDDSKDGREIGIQAFVVVGTLGNIDEQLAGVNEVALGFDGIVFDVRRDDAVGQLCVVDAVVIGLDVTGKILADKAVKQGAQHILLEVPAVDRTTYVVSDRPYLALQGCALLGACHSVFLFQSGLNRRRLKFEVGCIRDKVDESHCSLLATTRVGIDSGS